MNEELQGMEKKPQNIMLVAQRLSDFTEMRRASINLKKFGYKTVILFAGVGVKQYDLAVIHAMSQAKRSEEIDGFIIKPEFRRFYFYNLLIGKKFKSISSYFVRYLNPAPLFKPFRRLKKENVKTTPIEQSKVNQSAIKRSKKKDNFFLNFFIRLWRSIPVQTRYKFFLAFPSLQKSERASKKINEEARRIHHKKEKSKNSTAFFYKLFCLIPRPIRVCFFLITSFVKRIFYKTFFSKIIVVPLFYFLNYKYFVSMLKRNKVDLIILPEDIVGLVSPLLIKAGHLFEIPSLIIPYTIANQEEAFQSLKGNNEFSLKKKSNRIVAWLNRSWVMKDDKHAVLRLPSHHMLGHLLLRVSPPDPWMMNSGYANAIAVESQQMLDYYSRAGIPKSKLCLTGAFYDDELAFTLACKEKNRQKIYRNLSIQSEKPLLLIGGFPNQLAGTPPGFDFADLDEGVQFIVNCLAPLRERYEIILRPHPNFTELADIFAEHNILSTMQDTAELIAISDIYIAFASATIRWAVSCGIPTINYDIFYYDYSDFKALNSVANVKTKKEFTQAVHLFKEVDYYASMLDKASQEKQYWGMLDGKSSLRIHELIQQLHALDPVPRCAV